MANRTIKLKKSDLIKKIEENKANHIKDYEEAVKAYRLEVKEQITKQLEALEKGSLKIELDLIHPVNRANVYDEIKEMFIWEVGDLVDLTQQEFREYVQDQEPSAIHTRLLNASYKEKFL